MIRNTPVLPLTHSLVQQARVHGIMLYDYVPHNVDYPFAFITNMTLAPTIVKGKFSTNVTIGVNSDEQGLMGAAEILNKIGDAYRETAEWTKIEEVRMQDEDYGVLTQENAGRLIRYLFQVINVQFKIKR